MVITTTANGNKEKFRHIMKIDQPHYEKAYPLGRMLHEEKIDLSEARKEVVRYGLNPSSGSNLLRNVRHMLRGECYRRKMSIPATKQIDPIHDLRPVCPNCHAMLHTSRPALSIEALKHIVASATPIH